MRSTIKFGQVIEFIPDRLYLASYTSPPSADTLFPYPESVATRRSPSKNTSKQGDCSASARTTRNRISPCYFTIDDSLPYNAFHHDFGPLHIGHLYRFAVQFHDILGAAENKNRPVVLWSKADARSRANAACILASYMVLIQSWAPHLALAPIAQVDPPLMPFRDAGYSQADYEITIQDVVYGVWRAKEQGFCALPQFDLEEYERFERVDQGDFNWLTPDFIAFASPQHNPGSPKSNSDTIFSNVPKTVEDVDLDPTLSGPFKNVLKYFATRSIGLVVRLNSELYPSYYFTALGIDHLDMIFDDGTCPPIKIVRKFITLAHETITIKKKGIAVHCKAGLGRTGCLIGAYLIYRYSFTANEVIAYMRFMRPGMVVGPQQHWLHLNQGIFREWWIEEQYEKRTRERLASIPPTTPSKNHSKNSKVSTQVFTPPNGCSRPPLGEVDNEQRPPLGHSENDHRNSISAQDDCLPAPTPGQPRKTSRGTERHHPYTRNVSSYSTTTEKDHVIQRESEIISIHRSSAEHPDEDEIEFRMRSSRKASTSHSGRSISQTTTTIYTSIHSDSSNDIENRGTVPRSKTASSIKSGSGSIILNKVRGSSKRNSDILKGNKDSAGIRKTSGKLGCVGNTPCKVPGY